MLKSKVTTYTVSLQEMKTLIAKELKVPEAAVTVKYVIREVGADPMDRYRGTDEVTEIEVTVNNNLVERDNYKDYLEK